MEDETKIAMTPEDRLVMLKAKLANYEEANAKALTINIADYEATKRDILATERVLAGFYSTSNKYTTIGRVKPPFTSAMEALEAVAPDAAKRLREQEERIALGTLLRCYGHTAAVEQFEELPVDEYKAFRRVGGPSA